MCQGYFLWVQGYLKKNQREFQESFKYVSKVFQESFEGVPRKLLGCFKEAERVFRESFKGVSSKIVGCFK